MTCKKKTEKFISIGGDIYQTKRKTQFKELKSEMFGRFYFNQLREIYQITQINGKSFE